MSEASVKVSITNRLTLRQTTGILRDSNRQILMSVKRFKRKRGKLRSCHGRPASLSGPHAIQAFCRLRMPYSPSASPLFGQTTNHEAAVWGIFRTNHLHTCVPMEQDRRATVQRRRDVRTNSQLRQSASLFHLLRQRERPLPILRTSHLSPLKSLVKSFAQSFRLTAARASRTSYFPWSFFVFSLKLWGPVLSHCHCASPPGSSLSAPCTLKEESPVMTATTSCLRLCSETNKPYEPFGQRKLNGRILELVCCTLQLTIA